MAEVYIKKYNNIEDRIIIDTKIKFGKLEFKSKNTLIDTGANISCISKKLVKELKLVPIGIAKVSTPSGIAILNKYIIDISFKGKMEFINIFVLESEIGNQGIDLLLGMDILKNTDIAISNFDNHTQFSMRFPSSENMELKWH